MKLYYLRVMHPGGATYEKTLEAEGYLLHDGVFEFWKTKKLDSYASVRYTVCVFPAGLTIIESVRDKPGPS